MAEHDEQKAVVFWLRSHGVECFAVPNGVSLGRNRKRNAITISKLKGEGFLPGAPDLILLDRCRCGGHEPAPVAIEMKRGKEKPDAHQISVHQRMTACGWHVIVGQGCTDAVAKLVGLGFGA